MGLTRRRFLAVTAAAAVCVACSDDDEAVDAVDDGSGDDAVDEVDRDGDGTGFGGRVGIGTLDDVLETITAASGAMYVAEARAWVVLDEGGALLALYQKCTHLGCRVPWCASSKRFECPCHAAIFNRIGELVEGPAERGLDRFPILVEDDEVIIDTREIHVGPDGGELTVDGEPAGPVCVGPAQ